MAGVVVNKDVVPEDIVTLPFMHRRNFMLVSAELRA